MTAAIVATALVLPVVAMGQEEDSKPYVYAIYYTCDVERQELADEIVDLVYAPAYNAAVEAGEIQSWGWLTHHTGSEWRRLMYHAAPDMSSLLSSLEAINGSVDEKYPEMTRALGGICNAHVDYIWQVNTGSGKGKIASDRGKAGFSGYHVCEMGREERADEIVNEVFAPIFDQYVADGKIDSWGWMQHVVGGKYRRIETMTGTDHASLLQARGEILREMREKHEGATQEFIEICGYHQDFLWNIVHENP
jgi:hypothetical protein